MAQDPPTDVESGGGGEPHGPLYDKSHQFAQHELPPETPELVDPALRVMRDALQTQIIPHVGGKVGTAPLILAAFARRLIGWGTHSYWSPSRISSSYASCGRASASSRTPTTTGGNCGTAICRQHIRSSRRSPACRRSTCASRRRCAST